MHIVKKSNGIEGIVMIAPFLIYCNVFPLSGATRIPLLCHPSRVACGLGSESSHCGLFPGGVVFVTVVASFLGQGVKELDSGCV